MKSFPESVLALPGMSARRYAQEVHGINLAGDEQSLQASMIDLFHALGVFKRAIVFSIPNEGKRTKTTAGRLKAMGLLPGIADLCIIFEGRAHFAEVKTQRGRLSTRQKDFRDLCERFGVPWAIFRSVEEAKRQLEEWRIT